MRKLAFLPAMAAFLAAGGFAVADDVPAGPPDWMGAADISEALAGKTLEGRYADGKAFTERYRDDGRIEYSEAGMTLGGHWSITAGTLCTIYDEQATGGCFRIHKDGANCFEFYFATRTEDAAPGPDGSRPAWTARGSVSGEATACQDGANV